MQNKIKPFGLSLQHRIFELEWWRYMLPNRDSLGSRHDPYELLELSQLIIYRMLPLAFFYPCVEWSIVHKNHKMLRQLIDGITCAANRDNLLDLIKKFNRYMIANTNLQSFSVIF
jgi:hypothetical protein